MAAINPDVLTAREEAARALGLNPSTIAWPCGDDELAVTVKVSRRFELDHLSDDEWDLIVKTGILPDEPRQADMSQRELFDAVLTVVGRGRAWTELDGVSMSAEAVRKRFSRLARKGVWQALGMIADELALPPARRSILKTMGHRAEQMVRP